jgi:hypothetical protein
MPGIDLKQMWTELRPKLEAIWKFFDACLKDPFEVMQRGLGASGLLSPALTKGALGSVWAAFVWFATLPLAVLIYLPLLALAFPFILAWGIWCVVKWPFTPRRLKPTPASPPQPAGFPWVDTLATVPPGGSWLQYLWRTPLSIALTLLLAFGAVLAESLFLWLILLSFGMWVLVILGILFVSGPLFGYGVMLGRDDTSAGTNSFTAVCNYRNLTQREAMSTTFDTPAARDKFSCPVVKSIGK